MTRLRMLREYFSLTDTSTGKLLAELAHELLVLESSLSIEVVSGRRAYKRQLQPLSPYEESFGGRLKVFRLAQTNFRSEGAVGRVVNDLVFTLSAALSGLFGPKTDVNFVLTNPATLPLAALMLLAIKREKYIYLMHDIYPDIAVASGIIKDSGIIAKVFRMLQKWMLNRASSIIVLGECMSHELIDRYQVRPEKVHVVPNWWSPVFLADPGEEYKSDTVHTTFTYAGNMGRAQDFDTLMNTIGSVGPDVSFELIGNGELLEKIKHQSADIANAKIAFFPYLSEEDLSAHFKSSTDVALVMLNANVSGLAVPSKTYNLLAAGKPILAVVNANSEIAKMIERARCGIVVPPGDTVALREAIIKLSSHAIRMEMRSAALSIYSEYSLRNVALQTLAVVKQTENI